MSKRMASLRAADRLTQAMQLACARYAGMLETVAELREHAEDPADLAEEEMELLRAEELMRQALYELELAERK